MKQIIEFFLNRKIIVTGIIIFVAIIFYIIVRKIIRRVFLIKIHGVHVDSRRQKTMVGLIQSISKYFIAAIALLMILDTFGLDTKSLLASLGVVSLIGGLALQDILKDFIAGAGIIFENQYDVGDVVTIGDFKGTVTYLGMRSTRITAYTGEVMIVANRNVNNVINHSLQNSISLLDISVSYDTNLDKARRVLTDLCNTLNDELDLTEKATVCGVEKLGDSSIEIRVIFGSSYNNKYDYERIFRERIKKTFDENQIEIPFPQVVVHKMGCE